MVKQFSKRHLYSGMQGKVERKAYRNYEKKMKVYEKAIAEDLKEKNNDIIGIFSATACGGETKVWVKPILTRTRKLKRGIFNKYKIW